MTVLTLTHHLESHPNKQKGRGKGPKLAVRLAGVGVGILISSTPIPVRLRATPPSAARKVRLGGNILRRLAVMEWLCLESDGGEKKVLSRWRGNSPLSFSFSLVDGKER